MTGPAGNPFGREPAQQTGQQGPPAAAPPTGTSPERTAAAAGATTFQVGPPTINLPKGGGAIRGIGETFSANPVTGTASMSVPIATSPGRSGFGPQLALSYDSGAGNGPFGFGWNLAIPAVTRSTDKAIPRYLDAAESDVYVLSGSEDLVPVLVLDVTGAWAREGVTRTVDGVDYRVERYRPRVEGLFARIERWTRIADGDIRWRSISRDNVTSWYGKTAESRIADPVDPRRVFSWLLCEIYDDKGNASVYEYAAEDSNGVDLGAAHEANRTTSSRSANRYLKRIKYGNTVSRLIQPDLTTMGWLFEVVFDYAGDGTDARPGQNVAAADPDADEFVFASASLADAVAWDARPDAFSSYRAGFEVRAYRLCRRVLMFHHFPQELGIDDYLVRSTDFRYRQTPVATFLTAVDQSGYVLRPEFAPGIRYLKRSMPPVEFSYSDVAIDPTVHTLDPESLAGLPEGLAGAYQWVDLDGDGLGGVLTEQGENWLYKRNTSQLFVERRDGVDRAAAHLGPVEAVGERPALTLAAGGQFMDLAGDGRPDVVILAGPAPGLYERDDGGGWTPYRTFPSRPAFDPADPNLRFLDLDGDGHADALITGDEAMTWHTSLAEDGFGPERRVPMAVDEERGPRLVFADGTDSIHLADMTGDGSTDLVRIENGGVSYWPNLGYGRFGKRVAMDAAPVFDAADAFDAKRIRLIDIDGSGTTDIAYVGASGVVLHFNRAGNSWGDPVQLDTFPRIDEVASVGAFDLLGNGTGCLVWSSTLAGSAGNAVRYIDLMGGQKPHLLLTVENNLGAETHVRYAPSTRFYLRDRHAGRPWITRLPFPVQVVERVDTYDRISRNRFVTRYAYHHGFFDGVEREFRGFGMVEQWDTEEFAALSGSDEFPDALNVDEASHVPPVLTKTWFHTGAYIEGSAISQIYEDEYFREPGLTDAEFREMLLPDTVLPPGLTAEEIREACRALKGSTLRQEVFADDAGADSTADQTIRTRTPYTVTEQNLDVHVLQVRGVNPHAGFMTHGRETLTHHYERNQADPRIQHSLTLEVDVHGNVLKEASVAYGRRPTVRSIDAQGVVVEVPNPGLVGLNVHDVAKQTTSLLTYAENGVTNAIDSADGFRNPQPCEALTFELTGYTPTGPAGRFHASDFVERDPNSVGRFRNRFADQVAYEDAPTTNACRRPIECLRTLYRRDDLTALLPMGELESLGLPGERYQLAFTRGLLAQVFKRPRPGQTPEDLLPDPAAVLGGESGDRGGYVSSQMLKADGRFPASDADGHWWIPSGQSFFTGNSGDSAALERAEGRQRFLVPRRYRNPFGADTIVNFDANNLLIVETRDALGNRFTVAANDYRVLEPCLMSDPNGNQTEVAFDALGMVVGTALMGKPPPDPAEGDSLTGFVGDLPRLQPDGFLDAPDPQANAHAQLLDATTRIVYDLDRFRRTRQSNPDDPAKWQPACAATLARETHLDAPLPPQGLTIQISFSFSDGFGHEVQKKIPAEPGPLTHGGPLVNPRWVGSGWLIYNNKGKPVRQYEPFFSATHGFEFGVKVGVSPILFYDPLGRLVARLHPNHTYEKVILDPWRQVTWDESDTVLGDPRTDSDIQGYMAGYFASLPPTPPAPIWETWRAQRVGGGLGVQEQAAAVKASAHADTPTTAHFDALGRPYVTLSDNGPDPGQPSQHLLFASRVELDIESNQRVVRDAIQQAGEQLGRVVMRFAYDMLGVRIQQLSMDAGTRWFLNDAAGRPIRAWDSRGHSFRTEYDLLRRPIRSFASGGDVANSGTELLCERLIYAEQHPEAQQRNLRGMLYLHLDQAGSVVTEARDFKGNPLRVSRRLTTGTQYRRTMDWRSVDADHAALPIDATALLDPDALEAALAPLFEADSYTSSTTFDALNRPVTLTTPHTPGMQPSTIRPRYNEASLLERVDINRRGEMANGQPVWTPFVTNVEYDAKGQRQLIRFGNGVTTTYTYDPLTFRLNRLYARRGPAFTDDCQSPQTPPPTTAAPDTPPPGTACGLQNLRYTYDPVGNITNIQDDAQQTIFFRNQRVEPSAEYRYDALYRLIEATGREHLGQVGGSPVPHSHDDALRVGIDWAANDGNAMGTYVEGYVYDAVGNLLEMQHVGRDPAQAGWTRTYVYGEAGLIEGGGGSPTTNNQLSSTSVGTNNQLVEQYAYDAHGNITRMPHLGGAKPGANMHWDYRDRLRQTDLGGGGMAYFVYDASGQRVRKVWEKSASLVEERIYLGGFEIYRRRQGGQRLERETLHVMDDQLRIALVETRTLDTAGNDSAPRELIRYQSGSNVGSATVELDDQAQIISYEEYTPHGSTSYQAVRSQTQTPKRYRYTGRERDEESGLYYHGARYYAPWLGRWASADPIGIGDGINVFAYAKGNPITRLDVSGMDTLKIVRTDNFRQLLREAIDEREKSTITDKAFEELAPRYMKSFDEPERSLWGGQDPVVEAFKQRVDLFGRKSVKLEGFKPPGWEQSGGDPAACFALACSGANMTTPAGDTATGGGGVILYEAVRRRISTDKTASDLAVGQIRRHVEAGRAVVAGVNEPKTAGSVDPKKQPVTDHFVAIYGYETDAKGNVTALFAKDNAVAGTSEVTFIVNVDGSITKPAEKRPAGESYIQQEYQLSEVRFHSSLPYTGDLKPTNNANKVMYWPQKKEEPKAAK